MKTVWSLFMIVVMAILFLTFGSYIATEAGDKNTILDDRSIDLIVELNYETQTYNPDYVEEQESSLTTNSTFEGVDAFARQYLEDKSETAQKKSTVEKVTGIPDLVLKSLGFENNTLITTIKLLLIAMLVFAIGLAAYKMIRTGETG